MIIDSISGQLRSTRILCSLFRIFFCENDVMQTGDIITYGFHVQEALREYRKIVDSKRWEPTDSKNISKCEPLLLMASTVAI